MCHYMIQLPYYIHYDGTSNIINRDCKIESVVHGAMGCGQKKLSLSVAVPPAPVRVSSQRPLAPSVASVTNDKGDNVMIAGL